MTATARPSGRSAPRRVRWKCAVNNPAATAGTRPTRTHTLAPATPLAQSSAPAGARTRAVSTMAIDDADEARGREQSLGDGGPGHVTIIFVRPPEVHHGDQWIRVVVFHHP